MQQRPFGPPEDPNRYDDWKACIADMTDEGYSQIEAERICGSWKDETEGNSETQMTDHDDVEQRAHYHADAERVTLRKEATDDGTFVVRMPIASTGEVRNEGDEPLARDAVEGMARQIDAESPPVFLDHGQNATLTGSRYSALGKIGEWTDPELVDAGDETLLEADARLMDPETLPEATGTIREALATLKEQAKRDMTLSSSIGWREDDSFPGGVDLMEASIVGIPADPRTTSHNAAVEVARAALAADDDRDAETLVEEFRAVVMGSDADTTRDNAMSDDDTTPSDDEGDETRDESTGIDADEFRETMLEQQRAQTDLLNSLADALREDKEDDEDEMDDEEEDEDRSTDDESDATGESAGESDERTIVIDGEEKDLHEAVRELSEAVDNANPDVDSDRSSGDESDATGESAGEEQRANDPRSLLK